MKCISCNNEIDEISYGLNKKLLGKNVCAFYCVKCLALKFGCSERDLYDKAEQLRKQGCCYFHPKGY